jgi:hypothetical protein
MAGVNNEDNIDPPSPAHAHATLSTTNGVNSSMFQTYGRPNGWYVNNIVILNVKYTLHQQRNLRATNLVSISTFPEQREISDIRKTNLYT